jgi:sodium/proline symporter
MNTILLSFLFMLILFVVVGLWAIRHSKATSHDYLSASRSISPWLAALSAVATNNSGYMFVGMIGYTYVAGLSSIWLMVGWIIGDLSISLLTQRPLRIMAQRRNAHSFSGILAHWQGKDYTLLRKILGILTVLFLTLYASAQLGAGAKALHTLLGWDLFYGALTGAVIILFYSYSGGLRASIWTDALQSFVMIAAMGYLLYSGIETLGGITPTFEQLQNVRPDYMLWFSEKIGTNVMASAAFVLGWLFGGIGVIGQPHIVIRYLALDSAKSLNTMRIYYYSWFTLFYAATIGVGLVARLLIAPSEGFDPETALLVLSQQILPPALIGIMLAGLFAATISTADSLILSCSASLTRDFTDQPIESYRIVKLGTFGVTFAALLFAIGNSQTIFALVLDAWGVFGAALAPLILLLSLGKKMSEAQMILLLFTGLTTFFAWNAYGSPLLYAIAPAWFAVMLVYFASKKMTL